VLERINYSAGMLLDATDLQAEQAYFLDKARAHNRLHGWGTVCGLRVEPTRPPSTTVLVQPGVALDCCGREIVLTQPVGLDVTEAATGIDSLGTVFVVVEYGEKESAPIPVVAPDELDSQPGRMSEAPQLGVTRERPEEHRDSPRRINGVVPCPDCRNPALTLAEIDLERLGPITADRIDNTRRSIVPAWGHATLDEASRDTGLGPALVPEVDALQRRIAVLTTGVAVLAVGVVISLFRGQRAGQR
jgi:hypothetical protein